MAATYNDICVRVRSLLDDVPGAIYTNAFILPLVNQAQGIVVSELGNAGVQEVRANIVFSGATKISAGTIALTFSSTPALPANLIAPDRLMERKAAVSTFTVALAGLGAGNVDSGLHYYAYGYTGSFGTTIPGTVQSVTTTAGNGQVAISDIPDGPTGTTLITVYRTKKNATALYVLTTLAVGVSTYADNTADLSLTVAAPTTGPTVGQAETEWMPMRGARPLPVSTQTSSLLYWDWNGHTLQFIGSTEDRDVKMDYWTTVSDFGGTSGESLSLLGTVDILAPLTASLAAQSRGQAQMASFYGITDSAGQQGMAGRLLSNFINTTIKTQQSEPQRRAPYAGIVRYPAYQTPVWKQ